MDEGWTTPPPAPVGRPDSEEARWLSTARALNLNAVARSAAAQDLVAALVPLVGATEDRANQRRASGLEKLTKATGAVIGGLLLAWRQGVPAHRTVNISELVSPVAGGRQLRAALDGLVSIGQVNRADGRRYKLDWGDGASSHGIAPRFWPAPPLLALASAKGITPATVRDDFALISAEKPRAVKDPVTRKPTVAPGWKRQAGVSLPIDFKQDATARAIRHSVEQFNTFARQFNVAGCDPPQWRRTYMDCWTLGGRWTALTSGNGYQQRNEAERVSSITIDRSHLVEIDIHGSHLTIAHGLLGLPLPDGDLYVCPDVKREVTKAWITATLGKGRPVKKWKPDTLAENRKNFARGKVTYDLANFDPVEVGRSVIGRYPFLKDPADALDEALGLSKLAHIGKPETLLTHRLMAIEADAITAAMEALRAIGQLALPVHDSILVRGPYEPEAIAALKDAFRLHAGIVPRLKIERPNALRRYAA